MTTGDADWWSLLHTLDEPVAPLGIGIESILRPVDGAPGTFQLDPSAVESVQQTLHGRHARGEADVDIPRDFDYAASRVRFDRLAQWLSAAFEHPCDAGLMQDSACFGCVTIPAQANRSRTKRTRMPLSLDVCVSSFGELATYRPITPSGQTPHVHPDDRLRIEEALAALGYLHVPRHVLDAPYDGPNGWVFGSRTDVTWYTRFFDYL